VSGILVEIPCHFSSQIHTKLHDDSISITQILFFSKLEHDMDFGLIQVMKFPWHLLRKRWDFHQIWSHF